MQSGWLEQPVKSYQNLWRCIGPLNSGRPWDGWLYFKFCVQHTFDANFDTALPAMSIKGYVYVGPLQGPQPALQLRWKMHACSSETDSPVV